MKFLRTPSLQKTFGWLLLWSLFNFLPLMLLFPKKLWHIRKVEPETREFWRDPRPETHLTGGTRDPKWGTRDPRPRTLKVDFQRIFSVFFEAWHLWMNSCALCFYVYFVYFLLPYHKAYVLLIFHHLSELLFPSFCKNHLLW